MDGRADGRRTGGGRTDGGPDKLARPTLACRESSRTRSFARTHARNAIATETEIDFPVRGVWLTPNSLPPTSDSFDLRDWMISRKFTVAVVVAVVWQSCGSRAAVVWRRPFVLKILTVAVVPCPCPALPCPALPCPALPCPALPCPALSCVLSFPRQLASCDLSAQRSLAVAVSVLPVSFSLCTLWPLGFAGLAWGSWAVSRALALRLRLLSLLPWARGVRSELWACVCSLACERGLHCLCYWAGLRLVCAACLRR